MEKEQMIELLKSYNFNKYQIHNYKKELKKLDEAVFDYNIKLTTKIGINNDIHSKNNTSDKVFNAVYEIEKKKEQTERKRIDILENIKELENKTNEVDAFLNALYDFERIAVENFFIKHRTKFDIGEHIFLNEFGVPKSEKTISNIISKAFDKLL